MLMMSAFKDSFINKPLYKKNEIPFVRYVLQKLDSAKQEKGQLPDYTSIDTIEHVLPQKLDDEWKKYLGYENTENMGIFYERLEYIQLEEHIVNTIGNLCLIGKSANSSFGQDPFEKKKSIYTDVSSLTREIKSFEGKWDIKAIEYRSNAACRDRIRTMVMGKGNCITIPQANKSKSRC